MDGVIKSKDNQHIKEYAKLYKSSSYRQESSRFVIEGIKLFWEAFSSGIEIELVMITPEGGIKYAPDTSGINTVFIDESLQCKLTASKSPQGIFAVCKMQETLLLQETVACSGKYLALCEVSDPGNLGTMIRTAEAVGISGIILSDGCCDIYNPKTLRSSMGSTFRTAFMRARDIEDTLARLNAQGVQTIASVVGEAPDIDRFADPCVVCIGNEGNGLSERIIDICSQKFTLKMKGAAESLNASAAAAIIMWRMTQ